MITEIELFKVQPELNVTRYAIQNASFHHFQVQDLSTGVSGHGDASTDSDAQVKALFEFIERSIFRQQNMKGDRTSSGWAAHESKDLAIENSSLELLERDAVLCTWLCKIPPRLLSVVKFRMFNQSFKILQFADFGVHHVIGVIVETPSERKKMLLSTICKKIEDGIQKLEAESERAYQILKYDSGKLDNDMSLHHRAFNEISEDELTWIYSGGSGITFPENLDFTHSLFHVPLWDKSVAWVARASCAQLQALFFGSANIANINRRRLREVGGTSVILNRVPHPIL